jgi:predicted GNAT family acetyltransferase
LKALRRCTPQRVKPMIEDEPKIEREDDASSGRYVIHLPDGAEAEMTYHRRGATLVADHTFVPPQYRGRQIAEKLVARAVADARAEGNKIMPLCSFVAIQFRRHPEWADLHAEAS